MRKHLKSLSDVYFVDSTLRVREIFKSQKNSRVFINFKIAKSFKQFLHNAQSNSVQVSSVVFSLESGAPAIYFLSENSNGFYLAQLDLASIAKEVRNSDLLMPLPVMLLSKHDTFLVGTHKELGTYLFNLKSIIEDSVYHLPRIRYDNQNWFVLFADSISLNEVKICVLVPLNTMRTINLVLILFVFVMFLVMLALLLAKNYFVNRNLSQPIMRFYATSSRSKQGILFHIIWLKAEHCRIDDAVKSF